MGSESEATLEQARPRDSKWLKIVLDEDIGKRLQCSAPSTTNIVSRKMLRRTNNSEAPVLR